MFSGWRLPASNLSRWLKITLLVRSRTVPIFLVLFIYIFFFVPWTFSSAIYIYMYNNKGTSTSKLWHRNGNLNGKISAASASDKFIVIVKNFFFAFAHSKFTYFSFVSFFSFFFC